jgi:hypothetical protein
MYFFRRELVTVEDLESLRFQEKLDEENDYNEVQVYNEDEDIVEEYPEDF